MYQTWKKRPHSIVQQLVTNQQWWFKYYVCNISFYIFRNTHIRSSDTSIISKHFVSIYFRAPPSLSDSHNKFIPFHFIINSLSIVLFTITYRCHFSITAMSDWRYNTESNSGSIILHASWKWILEWFYFGTLNVLFSNFSHLYQSVSIQCINIPLR